MNKKNILHITPHLGGGVGRVILNYIIRTKSSEMYSHNIGCLEYANEMATEIAKNEDIVLFDQLFDNKEKLFELISEADIVLIHWWNHPLLYALFVKEELPSCRIVMWSHISGFHPPYLFTKPLFNYADIFVFTTPISFDANEIKELPSEYHRKLKSIWSTGGTEHVSHVVHREHAGFNIGYIGTVDYCKLHPDFIKMCSKVDIADAKFIVCGGHKQNEIKQEAINLGIDNKIDFEGQVPNISQYLSEFDIFGYPLAPYHYGTCEQALAEAMAAGVVPVVLANKTETFMVQDGITGIVAKNEDE